MKQPIHVSRFFFACLIAIMVICAPSLNAQTAKPDSMPPAQSAMKMTAFDLTTNNYTGFDDGSEKKLRNAVRDLRDAMPVDSQGLFRGYDLGLYRVSTKTEEKSFSDLGSYIAQAATNSKYYFVFVKIWKDAQNLDEFRVYFNLPNTFPANTYYTNDRLEEKCATFIKESYIEYKSNPERANNAAAKGILNWLDFLTKPIEIEKIDQDESVTNVLFTSSAAEVVNSYTFICPSGELIHLFPIAFTANSNHSATNYGFQFKTCSENCTPRGALVGFSIDGIQYDGYHVKDHPCDFIGYRQASGDYQQSIFFNSNANPNSVYIGISEKNESSSSGIFRIKKGVFNGTPKPFVNGLPTKTKIVNLPLNDLVYATITDASLSSGSKCPILFNLPDKSFGRKFVDVPKAEPIGTGVILPTFNTSDYFQDFTGDKFITYKNDLLPFQANEVNLVFTNSETPDTKITEISNGLANINGLQKAFCWIHVNLDGTPVYKVVMPGGAAAEKYNKASIDKMMATATDNAYVVSSATSSYVTGIYSIPSSGTTSSINLSKEPNSAPIENADRSLVNSLGGFRAAIAFGTKTLEDLKLDSQVYWDPFAPDYFLNTDKSKFELFIIQRTALGSIMAVGCGAETAVIDGAIDLGGSADMAGQILQVIFDQSERDKLLGSLKDLKKGLEDPKMRKFMLNMVISEAKKEANLTIDNNYRKFYWTGYVPTQFAFEAVTGVGVAKLTQKIDEATGLMKKINKVQNLVGAKANIPEELFSNFMHSKTANGLDSRVDVLEDAVGGVNLRVDGNDIARLNAGGKLVPPPGGLSNTMPNEPFVVGTVEMEGGGRAKVVRAGDGDQNEPLFIAVIEESDGLIQRILTKNKIPNSEDIRNTLQGIIGRIDEDVAEKFAGEFTTHLNKLGLTEADAPKKIQLFNEMLTSLEGSPQNGLGKVLKNGNFSDEVVSAWDKLFDINTPEKKWIRQSSDVLELMATKGEIQREKVALFYKMSFQKPTGSGTPPFIHQGTEFNAYGFPKFELEIPNMVDDLGKIGYQPSSILTGLGSDMTAANNWAVDKFNSVDKLRFKKKGQQCEILNNENKWITCVWHHHEDGKTMIPVPIETHNKYFSTGSPHTGGATILEKPEYNSHLIGFFNSPTGLNK